MISCAVSHDYCIILCCISRKSLKLAQPINYSIHAYSCAQHAAMSGDNVSPYDILCLYFANKNLPSSNESF